MLAFILGLYFLRAVILTKPYKLFIPVLYLNWWFSLTRTHHNLRFLVNVGGQNLKVLPDDVPERSNKSNNQIVHNINFDNYPITKIIPEYLKELGFEKQIIFSRPQVKVTASNETLTPFAGVQIEILAPDKYGNHIEIGFLNFPAWVRLDRYSKLFKPRIALNIPELHSEEYARRSKYELTHENRYQLILGNQRIVQVVEKIDAWELPKTKPLIEIICKSLKTKWDLLPDDKKEIIFQSVEFLKTSVRASIDGVRANKKLFHGANTELKDCLKYFYNGLNKLQIWEKQMIEKLIQKAHFLYDDLSQQEINDSIVSLYEHLSYKYDLFHVSENEMISLEKQKSIVRLLNHSKKRSALYNAIKAKKQKKQITKDVFRDFYTDTNNLEQSEVDQILHFIKDILLNKYSDHEIYEKLYYFLEKIGIPTHKNYENRSAISFGVLQQIPKYLSHKTKQKKKVKENDHFSKLLIIGLGNYWEGYSNTRHNIGFYALDKLTKQFSFLDFKFLENIEGFYSKKRLYDSEVILFKPAFALHRKDIDQKDVGSINVSGPPTEEAINFFKV